MAKRILPNIKLDNEKENCRKPLSKRPIPRSISTHSSHSTILKPLNTKKEPAIKEPAKKEIPMDIGVCTPLSDSTLMLQMKNIQIKNIDLDDGEDIDPINEYVVDMYHYLSILENENPLRIHFMNHQLEVTQKMRAVLVDWLVQVHQRFNLLQETLFLAIAIIDRYLQNNQVTKVNLQLLGVTALWIACKYEEMYAPEVSDFVFITDNTYDKGAICTMERNICAALDFKFGCPLPIFFLRRFTKAANADRTQHNMAKFFMELTLVDYDISFQKASKIAAAALYLALKMDNENAEWTLTIEYYSNFKEADILPLVYQIANLVISTTTATKLQAVYKKFQTAKYLRVARNDFINNTVIQRFAEIYHNS